VSVKRSQPSSAHDGFVVWFTGLSGAGKSTIAAIVEERLRALGVLVYNLDGDDVRRGLNRDLAYTDADRVESIRRISEVTRLMVNAGLVVIVAAISPFREGRQNARELFHPGTFIEVHVDTPLEVAEARDTKGLYRAAREGRLANFTGIDSPYEAPLEPEVRVTTGETPESAAQEILEEILARGLLADTPLQ
jgi:bifunctional enzyme CysN/CysC